MSTVQVTVAKEVSALPPHKKQLFCTFFVSCLALNKLWGNAGMLGMHAADTLLHL